MAYAANCPISRPVALPKYPADVDLNGVAFSYEIGLMYSVSSDVENPFVLPAPAPKSQ